MLDAILHQRLSDAQVAACLIALHMKGETADELFAGVKVLRQLAIRVHSQYSDLLDIVGTGGDQIGTFNISTACAFVAAAAGVKVAKHGSRSISSQSGSADVLQALGVNINLTFEQVAYCIDTIGIGFMFAPTHHPAMKQVASIRKQLGVRTIFNLLGPLTNPANAKFQVIGVFDQKWLLPFAQVLQKLGSQHALVVHARDGMDEISIHAETDVVELKDNLIKQYTIMPEDFQLNRAFLDTICIKNPKESSDLIQRVFSGEKSAATDVVILNAGAAIYTADQCDSMSEGVKIAQNMINSKKAFEKLHELIHVSHQFL